MQTDRSLSALPEEILVIILRECFAEKVVKLLNPSLRHSNTLFECQTQETTKEEILGCLNVLFVCKAFHRIALPYFYATVTFLWSRFTLKKADFPRKADFYHIRPCNRLRNLYSIKQSIGWLKINDTSKLVFLHQLSTFRIETKARIANNDHLKIVQELVEQCRAYNVYLELRLHLVDRIRNTSGSSSRKCSPFLRLIVDTDGGSEVVEAHMVDKEFFDSIKTKFDKLFGCDLPSPKFKSGKRRIVRATDTARSRWERFGTKF